MKSKGIKIVLNTENFNGLDLSQRAFERLAELGMKATKYKDANADILVLKNPSADLVFDRQQGWHGTEWTTSPESTWAWARDQSEPKLRSDPRLVRVMEDLGDDAIAPASYFGGGTAVFQIVEIPAGVQWHIGTYGECSSEYVIEDHRTWGANGQQHEAWKPILKSDDTIPVAVEGAAPARKRVRPARGPSNNPVRRSV